MEENRKHGRPKKEDSVRMENELRQLCFKCDKKDCVFNTIKEAYRCCVLGEERYSTIRARQKRERECIE